MLRRLAAVIAALAVTLVAGGGAAWADRAPARPAGRPPTEVTVTKPKGFSWPEALVGAGAAGGVIAALAVGAGVAERRRSAPPKRPSP